MDKNNTNLLAFLFVFTISALHLGLGLFLLPIFSVLTGISVLYLSIGVGIFLLVVIFILLKLWLKRIAPAFLLSLLFLTSASVLPIICYNKYHTYTADQYEQPKQCSGHVFDLIQ